MNSKKCCTRPYLLRVLEPLPHRLSSPTRLLLDQRDDIVASHVKAPALSPQPSGGIPLFWCESAWGLGRRFARRGIDSLGSGGVYVGRVFTACSRTMDSLVHPEILVASNGKSQPSRSAETRRFLATHPEPGTRNQRLTVDVDRCPTIACGDEE